MAPSGPVAGTSTLQDTDDCSTELASLFAVTVISLLQQILVGNPC